MHYQKNRKISSFFFSKNKIPIPWIIFKIHFITRGVFNTKGFQRPFKGSLVPVLTRENARKHFRPIIIKKLYQISQHFHLHRHVLTFRFPSSVHATSLRRIIDTSDEVNQNSVDKSTCGLIRTSAIPVYIRCQLVPRLTYWKSMPRTFDKALPPSLSLFVALSLCLFLSSHGWSHFILV